MGAIASTRTDTVVPWQRLRGAAPFAMPQATAPIPFAPWLLTRDRAAAALLAGGHRLILTGPPGTGKTVLLDGLARILRAAGRTVSVELADADPAPPAAGTTLLVDEADRLTRDQRRALLAAPGTVVLSGLDALAPRRLPRGTAHLRLAALDRAAAADFVTRWLALAGRGPADLDPAATRRLVDLAGGVPRLLATLLASAAWLADTSGAAAITAGHVAEAAQLRSVGETPPPPARNFLGAALAALTRR